jgi:hypothetical protein
MIRKFLKKYRGLKMKFIKVFNTRFNLVIGKKKPKNFFLINFFYRQKRLACTSIFTISFKGYLFSLCLWDKQPRGSK